MNEFEKYGVLEDTDTVGKTANEKQLKYCPECNSALIPSEQVNVLICPKCGTRPFEK